MEEYKINKKQLELLMNVLAEIPAKHSFNAINLIRNLPLIQNEDEKNKNG